jgi:glycosyltransferase involved in cell wall biosynthesis
MPQGWLSESLLAGGVEVERMPLGVARRRHFRLSVLPAYLRSLWRARQTIRAAARRTGAGIVHVNTSALPVAAILGRPRGARLVWQVHELVVRPRAMALVFRLLPPLTADRVIAVSDAVRRHLTPGGRFRRRVVTVHNGVADRPPAPMPDLHHRDRLLVAFVGRLNRWKGYGLFVRAVARLADRYPTVDFVIAGDAPPGEEWRVPELRRQLAAAGMSQRVRMLGFVEDGASVAEAADVVVIPSTWPEPFGMVALEAMRAGRVVVAAAHGGVVELVEDGVSGILFPPGDADALAEAIAGALDDPMRRAAIGAAARARALTEFSLDRMVDGVERVYLGLLS